MSASDSVILKFEQSAEHTTGDIKRIVGFMKLRHLANLITAVNLDSNPRSSKTGTITRAIQDSLDRTPETFPFKTKGILVGCASYRTRERQRYEIVFSDPAIEGILDGGHNALAIGTYILEIAKVSDHLIRSIKLWNDFKDVWQNNIDKIDSAIKQRDKHELDILIPVELLVPSDTEDAVSVDSFSGSLLDICAARNNNAQLKAETKANQSGYFEALREFLPNEIAENVEWKTNDGGRIKSADLVALSWIPLSLLSLPKDEDGRQVEAPVPQNIYRSKGDCVVRFERLMSSPNVSAIEEGKYRRELVSKKVESALRATVTIVELYDYIFKKFPDAYNANDGKFMRITAVKKMNSTATVKYTKFYREQIDTVIPEGFIIPLIYGLQALLKLDDDGCLDWVTDPRKFLERSLGDVIADYKSAVALLDYDPQKVGKAPEAYRVARNAYEMELLRSK